MVSEFAVRNSDAGSWGYMWPRITAEPWSAPPSASPSPWWCWRWGWRCPSRLPGRRPRFGAAHDAAAVAYDTIVRFLRLGLRTILMLALVVAAGGVPHRRV